MKCYMSARATLEGRSHGVFRLVKPSDAPDSASFSGCGCIEFIMATAGPIVVKGSTITAVSIAGGTRLAITSGVKHVFLFDSAPALQQAVCALQQELGIVVTGASALLTTEPDIFAAITRGDAVRVESELAEG